MSGRPAHPTVRGTLTLRPRGQPVRTNPETVDEVLRNLTLELRQGDRQSRTRPSSGIGWVSWLTAAYRDSLL